MQRKKITKKFVVDAIKYEFGTLTACADALSLKAGKKISTQNLSSKLKVLSPKFLKELRDVGVVLDDKDKPQPERGEAERLAYAKFKLEEKVAELEAKLSEANKKLNEKDHTIGTLLLQVTRLEADKQLLCVSTALTGKRDNRGSVKKNPKK